MLFLGVALLNIRNPKSISKLLLPIILLVSHLIYIQVRYQQLEVGSLNTGGNREAGFLQYLVEAALKVPKLIIVEFGFIAVNDSLFFILILWTLFRLWFKQDRLLVVQFSLVFFSSFFLAALNGPIGNGFRYQLPIVMFSLVVLLICVSPKLIWERFSNRLD
jgi:hypothetical protein